MGKLNLYTCFHSNLQFSSIDSEYYNEIIKKSYWELIELSKESKKAKFGIEFPAYTLEKIFAYDKEFIEEVKYLVDIGKIEIIGSAYSQNVFPLNPYEVNKINLELGIKIYEKFFSRVPKVFFVNEQCFSSGMIDIYKEFGIETIILDWDNLIRSNDYDHNLRYKVQKLVSQTGNSINILFNSSFSSYKFQRYFRKRLSKEKFLDSLLSNYNSFEDRIHLLYGTDWEVINFRPGSNDFVEDDIERIREIFEDFDRLSEINFMLPSEIVETEFLQGNYKLAFENAQYPIICKNRDNYNVTRWAVSGRDNVHVNSQSFKICSYYKNYLTLFNNEVSDDIKKKIITVFGSDFRTNTTDKKFLSFRDLVGETKYLLTNRIVEKIKEKDIKLENNEFIIHNPNRDNYLNSNFEVFFHFSTFKLKEKFLIKDSNNRIIQYQIIDKDEYKSGYLKKIKLSIKLKLNANSYEKFSFVADETENSENEVNKLTRSSFKEKLFHFSDDKEVLETDFVRLKYSSKTGLDIRELIFKEVSNFSLVTYLPPTYYENISHSKDYYSSGVKLIHEFGKVVTDTNASIVEVDDKNVSRFVTLNTTMRFLNGNLQKIIRVYLNESKIDVVYRFYLKDIIPILFRAGIFTLNPEAFDIKNLFFETHNGSNSLEKFKIGDKKIFHSFPVEYEASSHCCLGTTEGLMRLYDNEKCINFMIDKSKLFSVPLLEFEKIKNKYLLRLYNSISEYDDTGQNRWRGYNELEISIVGEKVKSEKSLLMAKSLNNNLILQTNDDIYLKK